MQDNKFLALVFVKIDFCMLCMVIELGFGVSQGMRVIIRDRVRVFIRLKSFILVSKLGPDRIRLS